jgi:hypothetical protein
LGATLLACSRVLWALTLRASMKLPNRSSLSLATCAIALSSLALAAISQARDNGQYSQVPKQIRTWIENLTDHRGIPRCATADGAVPDAWEMGADHYRVRIYGEWLDVPDAAVIKAPNRLGHAVVWIDASEDVMGVRCFLPGPQT